jgi:tRNA pseudouridine13 synthase
MATVRPREDDELRDERVPKRLKLSDDGSHQADPVTDDATAGERDQSKIHVYNLENLLPPSRELLGLPPTPQIPPDGVMHRTSEPDVGISEYIGEGLPTIQGIIKQRYVCYLASALGLMLLYQLYRFFSL